MSAATVISAIDQPVPAPGDGVEEACPPAWSGGPGLARLGGRAVSPGRAEGAAGAGAARPRMGRITTPTMPFDELHATAPPSAGLTATRTSATAELLELAGLVIAEHDGIGGQQAAR